MRGAMVVHVSQAWVEPLADDPEALSALQVARERLAAARSLRGLRRLRVLELSGPLPGRSALEKLLHGSIQFYHPHKERCTVRSKGSDPAPVGAGRPVVLVKSRGGERRPAAERWWLSQTGEAIEVRQGVAWELEFEPGAEALECARELAVLRDLRHGLLCNPYAQEARIAVDPIPLPWLEETTQASGGQG